MSEQTDVDDDAPVARCGRCGRFTWNRANIGTEDRMRQPDGYPCGGTFTVAADSQGEAGR